MATATTIPGATSYKSKICPFLIFVLISILATVASRADGSSQLSPPIHSSIIRTLKRNGENVKNKPDAFASSPVSSEIKKKRYFTASSEKVHAHKMSLPTLIVNIIADLCPHGMLPLAYGLAQGSGSKARESGPTGIIPALLLMTTFGAMSSYTMTSYAEMARDRHVSSIGELWSNLVGERSRWIVDLSIFSLCFGCCIFYSAFMGDIFTAVSSAFGLKLPRWGVLAGISSLVLLPLCLLEDLSALQFSSLLGVCGIAYTVIFHGKRVSDGSYSPPDGSLFKQLAEGSRPRWPEPKFELFNVHRGTLVLANMLCVAFLAHYNAISYSQELEDSTPRRYRTAIASGFGTALTVFASMMIMGYQLFGSISQPLILNNFHRSRDQWATVARIATGCAIIFAYPLMFAGLKSGMFALLESREQKSTSTKSEGPSQRGSIPPSLKSAAVLALITGVAMRYGEEDVSVVLGIVGSLLGCLVAYILPSSLRLVHMKRKKAEEGPAFKGHSGFEVMANHLLVLVGIVFGACGVVITLQDQAAHGHSHLH